MVGLNGWSPFCFLTVLPLLNSFQLCMLVSSLTQYIQQVHTKHCRVHTYTLVFGSLALQLLHYPLTAASSRDHVEAETTTHSELCGHFKISFLSIAIVLMLVKVFYWSHCRTNCVIVLTAQGEWCKNADTDFLSGWSHMGRSNLHLTDEWRTPTLWEKEWKTER